MTLLEHLQSDGRVPRDQVTSEIPPSSESNTGITSRREELGNSCSDTCMAMTKCQRRCSQHPSSMHTCRNKETVTSHCLFQDVHTIDTS